MSHECPGPGCSIPVNDDKLACRAHWFQVPMRVRNRVYSAWARGAGAGSAEHREAMIQAIAFMRPLRGAR
jgi:hypothetical protein